jgi:hypothetical protein
MSKFSKLLAGAVLALGVAVAVPQAAMAQHHGHWHGGGHWRGGGWGGGFGPGFALGFGLGAAPYYGYGPYYAAPYGGDCGWVRQRVWRHGYWVVRRVWRCF